MYKNYLLVAWRNLRRNKLFSFISIAGLALGMTCCFLILLYVRNELSYDRFHKNADRIYRTTYLPKFAGVTNPLPFLPPPAAPLFTNYFPEIGESARLFAQTATIALGNQKFSEQRFFFADPAILKIFTFDFLEGSPEQALAQTFSVILSAKTARKYFGNTPALGKTLLLDGKDPLLVSGVVADFPDNSTIHTDLITNYETMFATLPEEGRRNLPANWVISHSMTYVLLKPGANPATVNARFPAFLSKYAPKAFSGGIEYKLQPMTAIHLHSNSQAEPEPVGNILYVYIFTGIAVITLLIAGINFVNLSTARSLRRAREVGMRKVLGAERSQLIGQFLGEALLLSLLAFCLSLALLVLSLPAFNDLAQKHFTLRDIFSDGIYLSAFLAMTFLTGVLAGLYPAFFLSGYRPTETLKADFSSGRSRGGILRHGLLVFQYTASVALIISTLVVFRQLEFVKDMDLGFKKDFVLLVPFKGRGINNLFDARNDTLSQRLEAYRQEVLKNPRVQDVALSDVSPGQSAVRRGIVPQGFTASDNIYAMNIKADYSFIPAYGMKLVAGRNFSLSYGSDKEQGFIINETGVKRYHWGSPGQALGKRIALLGKGGIETKSGTIIGVVKDFHAESLFEPLDVVIMDIDFSHMNVFSIRIRPDQAQQTVAFLEKSWNLFFPQKDFAYTYLDQDLVSQYADDQRTGKNIGCISGLAIFISCLGLFGLIALTGQQRIREIGIRKILGATVPDIVVLVSKKYLILITVGVLTASPLAWLMMHQWLMHFAFRIDISWWIFVLAGVAALLIAALTVSFQVLRVAMANPTKSLREQ
ncbi:MAG TPA: ABC transporter permease [Puia sp.]|nr:ABC transporter permease [Puia sp.]